MQSQRRSTPSLMDLIHLIYASAASRSLNQRKLPALLKKSRENNAAVDITGLLLYKDGAFFQILEGDRPTVLRVFEKIKKDPRHTNITVLLLESIPQRNFADHRMGFVSVDEDTAALPGFSKVLLQGMGFLDLQGDAARTQKVIENFKDGYWRPSKES